ncbi:hypothetical protein ATU3B_24570 [Agrobacterium genomosp. 3 str. CIP 111-78]|uniref:Uncharacterized protein n=1 Tax=Agrobacterium tumefaciens TaxID=358 RepID=A0AAE6BKP5_AGRTU|nr:MULTISPECIES: hypothetical protein [Agrobacterium tumefaciens complex]MCA2374805.1 hypothetical protein [Agrobacterium tomkonis CIP 111-78]QCM00219.1 hypothetical protein CFBP6624_08745 [Agrobacterium tumefaciens]
MTVVVYKLPKIPDHLSFAPAFPQKQDISRSQLKLQEPHHQDMHENYDPHDGADGLRLRRLRRTSSTKVQLSLATAEKGRGVTRGWLSDAERK